MSPFWHPLRHLCPQGIESTVIFVAASLCPNHEAPPRPARSLMRKHWGLGITRQVSGLSLPSTAKEIPNSFTGLFDKKKLNYFPCTQHPRHRDPGTGTFIAAGGTKVLCHCAWPHSYHLSKIPISHMQNSSKGSLGKWPLPSNLWSTGRRAGGRWVMNEPVCSIHCPQTKHFLRSNTKWKTHPAEKK